MWKMMSTDQENRQAMDKEKNERAAIRSRTDPANAPTMRSTRSVRNIEKNERQQGRERRANEAQQQGRKDLPY